MSTEPTSVYVVINWPLIRANVELGRIVVTQAVVVFYSGILIGSK